MIVGAYAVNIYADPRATGDLDINKRAAGRPKDLADLDVLEKS